MGSYTSTQKLYKTSPNEVVDVETQLNYNLRRLDSRVRSLVEYQVEPTLEIPTDDREVGMKWFKSSTNSFWLYKNITGFAPSQELVQANDRAQTDDWHDAESYLKGSWVNPNAWPNSHIAWRKDSAGMVEWRGIIALSGYADFQQNVIVDVLTIPTEALPSRAKYFTVAVGDGFSNGVNVARVYMGSNGYGQMNYMGADPEFPEENNYLNFADVWYPTDD